MTKEEYTLSNGTLSFILKSDEDKVLVRKSDGQRFGQEIYLGYTYYLNGKRLDEPKFETPEDYFEDEMNEEEKAMYIEGYISESSEESTDEEQEEEVEEQPTKEDEPSSLDAAKKARIKLIEAYDKSSEVNCFFYNDVPMWLNLDRRIGLARQVNSRIANGEETIHLVWTEPKVNVTLPCEMVLDMLNKIEVYAGDCTVITNTHINEVKELTDISAVNEYDITKNYPSKIYF